MSFLGELLQRIRQWWEHVPDRPDDAGAPAQSSAPSSLAPLPPQFSAQGGYDFDLVGESNYQRDLRQIAPPATDRSRFHKLVATVELEDENPHDRQAVLVSIGGNTVAYFSREDARRFRRALMSHAVDGWRWSVRAVLVGGWDRGFFDRGSIGVRLDLEIPRAPRKPRAKKPSA